jgi:integrase
MTKNLNFTKTALLAIKPPLKPENKKGGVYDTYKDTKEKGLVLLVSNGGSKTFYLYRKINGRPERIKLGAFPDMSVENARDASMVAKKTIIVDKKNPNEEKKKVKTEVTFGEMFHQFMERYSKKNKRSWKYDEREVNKFLSHWFKKKASQISKQEIQRLHENICSENGLYQANRLLERIRAIYNKSIEWGWEGLNPTLGIKKFKEKSRDRFLQADELPCLFQALAEEVNAVARDYILISLLTGARKSNVLSMRWNEVNFEIKTWRIPETKNGEPLTIPLTEQALQILLQRKIENKDISGNGNLYVFPSNSKQGHLADPKKPWKRICLNATIKLWQLDKGLANIIEKVNLQKIDNINQVYKKIIQLAQKENTELPIGLMDVRIHDLRRTLGSWQAATGATTAIIGKSLGHKSQQATAIYERLNIDPVRASVERATEAMFGKANK